MATGKVNRGLDADLISERREVSRISFSAGQACTVAYNNSQRVLGSFVKNSTRGGPSAGGWPVKAKKCGQSHGKRP